MKKEYAIPAKDIVTLVPHSGGCLATDKITVEGKEVGYMYREVTQGENDTGWRFFAGDESEEYISDSSNSAVYSVNTIANYDPAILKYIDTPAPCAFEKRDGRRDFREVTDETV